MDIEKLSHPYKLVHKKHITSKNGRVFFCDGFPKERREKFFSKFLRIFLEFSHSFHSVFLFLFLPRISHFFFIFFTKNEGVFIGEPME